ncbi:MAG: DUF2089 domain-containing protein [Anaerolineaceae bacterium]|jgi:hypothetical protein|nr:MAG: DUF2089 domain-containing protein [Anaerolineaceae bacterium]
MNKIIDKCPICNNDLIVTSLHCNNCRTNFQGVFELTYTPLSNLTPEQLQFVLTFIRCEGKFNRMEEEMDLSYPTLRSRFNEILRVMGFESQSEDEKLTNESRKEILTRLNEGKISIDEAQELLRGS